MLRPAVALSALIAGLLLGMIPVARAADAAADWQRGVQVDYRVEADGRYQAEQHFDIQVHTPEAARQTAQQSYGWSSGLESIELVEAYTRKADGSTLPVAANAVLKQAVAAGTDYPSFSDWQVRTVVFPDVQAGDTVHYVLRRIATEALFPGVFEAALRLGRLDHLTPSGISLDLPPGFTVQVAARHLQEDAPITAADGRITRHWHLRDAAGATGEPEAEFTASSFPDYPALGAAFAARALPRAVPDDAVRGLAKRLTAGITDRREQAQAVYDYVAGQIRYVGLQLGPGRIVPRPAGTVLASGYGDCKDHVALLSALLNVIGIESEPALISTKARYDLPDPPTLDVLDHVILHVPEMDVWLDATSPFAPFGVLPIGEYGKPVVMAGAQGARLDRVPALPRQSAWTKVSAELDVTEDGAISGQLETTAGGAYAVALREIADGLGSVADQLRRLGSPGNGSYAYDPPMALDDDRYAISADFTLEDGLADLADHRWMPTPGPTVMVRPGNFLIGDAVGAEHTCYSGTQAEDIRIHLPANLQVSDLPHDVTVTGGFARYHAAWRRDNDDIVVSRSFSVDTPHPLCSAAEYNQMKPVLRAARLDLRTRLALEEVKHPVLAAMPSMPADPLATVRAVGTTLLVRAPVPARPGSHK